MECLLNNNKNSDFCAPLTSFDWNEVDPYLLGKGVKECGFQLEEAKIDTFSDITLGQFFDQGPEVTCIILEWGQVGKRLNI